MQTANYWAATAGATIELVVTGSEAFHDTLRTEPFWSEYIPRFDLSEKQSAATDEVWQITESANFSYSLIEQSITTPTNLLQRLIIVLEARFEYLRQKQGLYTLHGSVIAHKDKAIGFIGNVSGMGKTSLASYASLNGWNWLADEKFTVNGAGIVGSTSSILNDHKTRSAAGSAQPSGQVNGESLVLLCQPIVTSETRLTRFDMDTEKALWVVYEEMTRDIRQVQGFVYRETPLLPSLDTDELAVSRYRTAERLIRDIPVVQLRGSEEVILSAFEKLVSS